MARSTETIMNEFNKPKLLSRARDKARKDARDTKNIARRTDTSDVTKGPKFNDKAKSAAKKEDDKSKDRSTYLSSRSSVGPKFTDKAKTKGADSASRLYNSNLSQSNKNIGPDMGGKPTKNTVSYQMEKEDKPAAKKQSFGSAFATARSAGLKTFEYKGKKYTTERADDKKAPSKKAAKPAAKPAAKGNMGSRSDFSDDKVGPNMSARKKPENWREALPPDHMQRQAQRGLTGYKVGGMVKSKASSRADGCAVRGKTKA